MNSIRSIRALNKRELEAVVSTEASWHADYRGALALLTPSNVSALTLCADTAYVYIGGLPFDLSEGDILTIFSQYGEPTYLNLIRDKDSGKSKGFAFLKYEDQRSTDLAVDNLGGATIMGRILKVDHTRYKRKDGEEEEEREKALRGIPNGDMPRQEDSEEDKEKRPMLKEEVELQKLIRDHDEDDPMKEFLVQEKREEVAAALAQLPRNGRKSEKKKHYHHHRKHHHRHRSRRRSDVSESDSDRKYRYENRHGRRSRSP